MKTQQCLTLIPILILSGCASWSVEKHLSQRRILTNGVVIVDETIVRAGGRSLLSTSSSSNTVVELAGKDHSLLFGARGASTDPNSQAITATADGLSSFAAALVKAGAYAAKAPTNSPAPAK